jgi:hypothetical protein
MDPLATLTVLAFVVVVVAVAVALQDFQAARV